VDYCAVNVNNRCIITEVPSRPHPAAETNPAVPEAIVYTAIKTNVQAPVPTMKAIEAAFIAPIRRCP
jgi:hypothetical protein